MIRVFEPWTSPSDVLEVNKALIKKQISGSSTYIGKLEEKFTQFIGMKYGIAVSNGSVALDLALQTLDLDENDEIILPAFVNYFLFIINNSTGANLCFLMLTEKPGILL